MAIMLKAIKQEAATATYIQGRDRLGIEEVKFAQDTNIVEYPLIQIEVLGIKKTRIAWRSGSKSI